MNCSSARFVEVQHFETLLAEMDRLADFVRVEALSDRICELSNQGCDVVRANVLGEGKLLASMSDELLNLLLIGGTRKVVLMTQRVTAITMLQSRMRGRCRTMTYFTTATQTEHLTPASASASTTLLKEKMVMV